MIIRAVTRAGKKPRWCAQGIADQVAQRSMMSALIDPVALAEPFDANDSFAHWLHDIGNGCFHLLKIHEAARHDHENNGR